MDSLTLEVVTFNILTRVPLDTLGKCRATCKDWNEQTQGSEFKESRQRKVQDFQGYILQNGWGTYNTDIEFISSNDYMSHGKLCMDFLSKTGTIEAVDQGILYYLSDARVEGEVAQHYICKPTTKQWKDIPKSKIPGYGQCSALKVLTAHPLRFKILRLINIDPIYAKPNHKVYSNFRRVEIFDSKDWTWKPAKKVKIPYTEYFGASPPIFVNGAFHWLTSRKKIFAYDLEQKTGGFIWIPKSIHQSYRNFELSLLTKHEGHIAICAINEDQDLHLWVFSENEWTLSYTWKANHIGYPKFADFQSTNVIIDIDSHNVYLHNMEEGSTRTVERTVTWGHANVYPFVTDDVPVELLE